MALPFWVHARWRLIPKHYCRISKDAQRKTQLKWERRSGQVCFYFTCKTGVLSCYILIPLNLLEAGALDSKMQEEQGLKKPKPKPLGVLS